MAKIPEVTTGTPATPNPADQAAPAEASENPVDDSLTTNFCDQLAKKDRFEPYNMGDSIDAAACDAKFKERYELDCGYLIPGPLSGRCYIKKK